MFKNDKVQIIAMLLTVGLLGLASGPAAAAVRIEGQAQAGGGPLAMSTVTLWAASAGEPKQLAQTRTRADGRFELRAKETTDKDAVHNTFTGTRARLLTPSGKRQPRRWDDGCLGLWRNPLP
jgi:hypothetical protein